ncbi:MAG TPA: Gfo/Idh/MocA family oxidoreductase [Terriglobia bacterium]|nr:Gfo/Idh/MocA family oxidoreductase [Terriglobia bacterium]
MRTIRFGLIGCGLMGREFASALARWCHLQDLPARPQLVAVCDRFGSTAAEVGCWLKANFPSIQQVTEDYRELLANPDVEAVYCAVPHHLHQEFYCAALRAGKHLMGEKPFGIDVPANQAILRAHSERPKLLVRCSSEFPFFPAVQRIGEMIEREAFGRIMEVNCGFLHSSDMDPNKPINWKRQVEFNGEYGCMGDLGMHVCHLPFRAGWRVRNVRAILSKIIAERPDDKGGLAPCRTWDNATLFCDAACEAKGAAFPLTLKTHRMAPGEKNTWYVQILGTKASARFSTRNPRRLELLEYCGGEQSWQQLDMGQETAFKTISASIFEFGFSDAILQMWAAFVYELATGQRRRLFAGCVTPEETALSHQLFTAALESYQRAEVVSLQTANSRNFEYQLAMKSEGGAA